MLFVIPSASRQGIVLATGEENQLQRYGEKAKGFLLFYLVSESRLTREAKCIDSDLILPLHVTTFCVFKDF